MFDKDTKHVLAVAKAKSQVRDSLLGLEKEEKIRLYIEIVKKHPLVSGAISNAELGLVREVDYHKLAPNHELAIRQVFTLASIGRLFFDKVSSFLPIASRSNEERGREILLKLKILRKVSDKKVEPFLPEYSRHFLNGKCAAIRPKFLSSVKPLIAQQIRAIYKSNTHKETDAKTKTWILRKKGKVPYVMSHAHYQAYSINKTNGIVEMLDWEDLPTTPFNGEGHGFVGRHQKQ